MSSGFSLFERAYAAARSRFRDLVCTSIDGLHYSKLIKLQALLMTLNRMSLERLDISLKLSKITAIELVDVEHQHLDMCSQ